MARQFTRRSRSKAGIQSVIASLRRQGARVRDGPRRLSDGRWAATFFRSGKAKAPARAPQAKRAARAKRFTPAQVRAQESFAARFGKAVARRAGERLANVRAARAARVAGGRARFHVDRASSRARRFVDDSERGPTYYGPGGR